MAELLLILWFVVIMCTACGFLLGYLFGKFRTLKEYEDKHPITYDYVDNLIGENEILTKENIELMKRIAELMQQIERYKNDR